MVDYKTTTKTVPTDTNKDILAKQKSFLTKPPELKKQTEKIFERRQTHQVKEPSEPLAIPKKTVLYEEAEYFSFLKPNQARAEPRKVFCHITDINAFHDTITLHNEGRMPKKWPKDREERFVSRVSKERKAPAFIRPMNFPTMGVNSEHPILEKNPNSFSQIKLKPFNKEPNSGRELIYHGDSAFDIKTSHNTSKDFMKKFSETQYGLFHREARDRDNSLNNTIDRNSKTITKTRGAHTLEPLNKISNNSTAVANDKSELLNTTKTEFKGKSYIRHPGFQRRLEEENTPSPLSFKDTILQKHILKSPSEIFRATGGLSNLIGTERFKQKATLEAAREIINKEIPDLNHLKSIRDHNDSDLPSGIETPKKSSLFKREQALLKHSSSESQKTFKDYKRPMLIYTTPRVWDSKGAKSLVSSPVMRLGVMNNVNGSLNGNEVLKNML